MNRYMSICVPIVLFSMLVSTSWCQADIVYNILPQSLVHETDGSDQYITGGTITMVDGAEDDGVLLKEELIDATVFNTMAGTIHAYDDFDFSQIDAVFDDGFLVGSLRIQHTDNGEGFVEWDASNPMISISDLGQNEYAQLYPWNGPHRIAVRSVPEPATVPIIGLMAIGYLARRKR